MRRKLPTAKASRIPRMPCYTKTQGFKDMSHWYGVRTSRKKKTRGKELTPAEKQTNRAIARVRVKVEHALAGVKRARIVKDVFRNTKEGDSDSALEAACGLHNLRTRRRKTRWKS